MKFLPLLSRALYLYLLVPIETWVRDCSTIADVGCGDHSPLKHLKFSGQKIGIDGYAPAIEASKHKGIHQEYVCCDFLGGGLPARCFDAVVALEVLEHLPKQRGPEFLASLEHAANKVVIISTPNGFVRQDAVGGNPFQRHLSGWDTSELRAMGYTVHGVLGLKSLRGERAQITRKPRMIWALISRLTQSYVWDRPEKAFGLLCYKRIGGTSCG